MISVMSENLANKIAAGEVIEKISSIVKELVENSIDAHSTNIKVNLTDSGFKKIEVIDDGIGMDSSDAKTCFLRHATSKIKKEDDLFFIETLGFRGEAIPSIASVSEVILKTCNGKESSLIHIKGGAIIDESKCDERKGTSFEVTNIFYNTPARLKYLKTPASELASCTALIERLALSHTDISFTLTNNSKELVKSTGSGNLLKCIHEVFGSEISQSCLEFKSSSDDFIISGFACKPHIMKSTRSYMITLINGRVVRNNEINNAINDAYHTYKYEGRYPFVIMNIETDPTIVDVNIHPTKQDVKISKMSELTDLIVKTIKDTLYTNMLIVKPLEDIQEEIEYEEDIIKTSEDLRKEYHIEDTKEEKKEEVKTDKQTQITMDFQKEEIVKNEEIKSLVLYPVGLVHGTYIVAENDEGMFLIDQHAAYERINYERFMKALKDKSVDKVLMLFPITIEYSASDYQKIIEHSDFIKSLNIDFEDFGINTIVVKAHPTYLKEGYEEESIRKILDLVISIDEKFDRVKFEESLAITLACKMSIKANHHISTEEMDYILKELVKCDNPYNCPHGRPTIVKFTPYDLEKLFKRAANW